MLKASNDGPTFQAARTGPSTRFSRARGDFQAAPGQLLWTPENLSYLHPAPTVDDGRKPMVETPEVKDSWTARWIHACEENSPWLTMSFSNESGHFPWCGLCGKWAGPDHLTSQKCQQKRDAWQVIMGPRLQELISHFEGGEVPETRWRRSKAASYAGNPEAPPASEAAQPQPEPGLGGIPKDQRRRCLNQYCNFLEHELRDEFQGYCCKACAKWEKEGYKKKTHHGVRCQREVAQSLYSPVDSPEKTSGAASQVGSSSSPEQPNVNWKSSKISGAERGAEPQPEAEVSTEIPMKETTEDTSEYEYSFHTKVSFTDLWATASVDPMAPPVQHRPSGKVCGTRLVVLQSNYEAPEVLRMEVSEGLWITLAERDRWSWEVTSSFQDPGHWNKHFRHAKHLSEAWSHADDWWKWAKKSYEDFLKVQDSLRDSLHMGQYANNKEGLQERLTVRNKARENALEQLEAFIVQAGLARKSAFDWHGGAARIERVENARHWADDLKEGNQLDVDEEMKDLKKQYFQVVQNRNKARTIEAELQNELDLETQGQCQMVRGESEVAVLRSERDKWREQEKRATSLYFKKMAELCLKADRLSPEMLPALRSETEGSLARELSKLKPHEQAEVMKVLDHNISITHYDPDQLREAKRLSCQGARHAIYEMVYAGSPCVVKVFDFTQTHRGLSGFVQEVVLHVRLRHPLVVPLRRAFIDHKEQKGFLQFDRYECNLHDHLRKMSRPQRLPHKFGEPAEAGVVDQLPRRITQLMIQSVAHVHGHKIVHADLKPSNWLWDSRNKVPILCDFETAKDHGVGITMTSKMQSQGFTAPELEDPTARPTLASDVFALGKSIAEVLSCVPNSRPSERDELQGFVNKMLCNEPSERITAAAAAEAWWNEVLAATDGYQHLVTADEVLYTQAECSAHFNAGQHRGQPLEDLIDAIIRDPEYTLKDDRLIIDVVKKGSALLSVDNRRLYCFKEAQRTLKKHGITVWIRIREHQHSVVQERFVNHFETRNAGKSIYVRRRCC